MFQEFRNQKRTNGKWQLSFVFCKQKMEMANFRLFAANENGKWKVVFLGQQMFKGNRQLLFEQT
jgi:hypothetical protein